MIESLQKLFSKKKIEIENKNTLISSLAPKILTKKEDIAKIQPYLDKLNETIDAKGVNNIALTGGYGSGKSTIIGTFKSLNSQYEYLNISLASFNKKKSDDKLTPAEKKSQKEELERLLEVSILQQIFYHVKPSEIPESRFKRIIKISNKKVFLNSISLILWVLSVVLLLKYNYLDKINPTNWKIKDNFDWFALFIFIVAFIGIGMFSKLFTQLFSNSKINKVNIKGEIELGDNVNKSVFNEHLEEILYFFENTLYNVVLIEDLDRFDSTDIFTKLREINILLNNSKLIEREINFVYAVGDDLFDDKKERVKFFEYIIPVIPFINSSNADEQLLALINESRLEENIFTQEFLSDITTFIDDIDMRLLTSIFHEFVIYRSTLKPEFIKKNDELFAMITYKNIDPKDFTLLNRKEGKLFDLINNKKSYIEKLVSGIDTKIKDKYTLIKNIENHITTDIEELKSVYLKNIMLTIPKYWTVNIEDALKNFQTIITNNNIQCIEFNSYHSREYQHIHSFDFEKIQNKINSKFSFKDRVSLIEFKQNNKVDNLKSEIEKLKKNKLEIENWDLQQIFLEVDIDDYVNDFSNNLFIRNLILNGYINENYNDYISLFHEISITKEDFKFERNVKGGYSSDFNYKLSEKIENLIEKISDKYFEREVILNFDLLVYLVNNYSRYSTKYDSIIRLLSNEKEKSIQFIDEYVKDENKPLELFIEKLVENWKGFWDYIYLKSNYTEEKVDKYLEYIIRFAKNETILKSQNINTFKIAVEERSDFLSLIKNTNELDYYGKLTLLIKNLNIKFNKLDEPKENTQKLFNYVFENDNYRINKENLLQMYLAFGKDSSIEQFNKSNYSAILNSDCKQMIDYIESNIYEYVEDVYLKLDENKFENEDSLLKLLNNENLSVELQSEIIEKVNSKISNLADVDDLEIKEQLILNNKLVANWKNVIDYYTISENVINENLIEYLEFDNVNEELSKEKLLKDYENFEGNLLRCNNISDDTYIKLIESCYFRYIKLNFENLNEEKAVSLVDKTLTLTKENYDLLRANFPNNHIKLIEKSFTKFIEKVSDFEMDKNDVLLLLQSAKITLDNRFKYIGLIEQNIISESKEISKEVSNIIIQKSTKIEFEFSTIESIIKNTTSTDNKIKLLNLYFNDIENSNIILLLKGIWGYEKLFEKGKPTYSKSDYNRILFEKLKTKNIIKNCYDDKWNNSNFRITTNY
ncbi:YobI family P-loop NTPase [Flavobacterium psychrophilum]|uniref:YobI family P-loop NTPase n=1 Tax=Flavobacterium psychrophilum TaxID=96345 RepID=UPI000B7C32EE|nr:hypothetical protein [Flavobacterium psychrophilum]SNA85205.1 conserved hypothetical protein [Flavobacterium psychrophilum]